MRKLKYECFTYKGGRENNEDACLAVDFGNGTYLFAVADGMGGAKAGEFASKTAVDVIQECVRESLAKLKVEDELLSGMKTILSTSCMAIQTDLADIIKENTSLAGMGTTLVAILVHNGKYVVANIGDSRAYLISHNKLLQITEDHSYLAEFKKMNSDPVPDTLVKQYGHLVTRVLVGGRDKPDIFPEEQDFFTLEEGEGFLLCSDGLIPSKALEDSTGFEEITGKNLNLKKTGKLMAKWAENNGSTDNISLILVRSNWSS